MNATAAQLKAECKRLGIGFAHDEDCQCYRASCPSGKRFDIQLHELIAVYGVGIIGNGGTCAEAREDLLERLREYLKVEECDDPDCDWCTHNPDAQILGAELGEANT